jgi:hypothetical protein
MTEIQKIAFIIPIHPPKYDFIYSLIEDLKNNNINIDLFLVFSNEEDYSIFYFFKDYIKPIFLPENTNTQSIVTYKKFYALNILKDNLKYDYFIVCDSEIKIIASNFNELNIINKIKNIFENKKIYGIEYTSYNPFLINKSCRELFKNDTLSNYSQLHTWWNNIPVYKRNTLDDFFDKITLEALTWYHFDYIIYEYYLILYQNFKMINITHIVGACGSIEFLYDIDQEMTNKLKLLEYGFSWVPKRLYVKAKELFNKNGAFIQYHLDYK